MVSAITINTTTIAIAPTITQARDDIPEENCTAFIVPPIPIIGANIIILKKIYVSICI